MTHSAWWLVVDALAVYRLTRLVVRDSITERAREWVRLMAYIGVDEQTGALLGWSGPGGAAARWTFQLVSCSWCMSVWLGAIVVALTATVPGVWQYPGMALALSAIAGYLAER